MLSAQLNPLSVGVQVFGALEATGRLRPILGGEGRYSSPGKRYNLRNMSIVTWPQ